MEQEYIDVEWRETEPSGAGSTGNGLATETAGNIAPVDGITYESFLYNLKCKGN